MAVISPDTFNPLKRYVRVRLQQGVPIVDADWNELDDVRQFELRAYLKWFVGDGIPEGNDGFRIDGSGALANDFTIRAGVPAAPAGTDNVEKGLSYAGRCVVDGLDVIIDTSVDFSAQPLHITQAGSAALAAAWGVPQILALAFPPTNSTVTVYLDVWHRQVTPTEEPTLVHPGLGTESCARLRREWAVRVRDGATTPASADADFLAGHSYYALALISRSMGDPIVRPGNVTDLRERRLLVPPANLITDLLGVAPQDYRRGLGRPAISLREAINALLRGELPATPDAAIMPAPGTDLLRRGIVFDAANGIVTVWSSNRDAAVHQVFAARLDIDNTATGFGSLQQVTSGGGPYDDRRPHALELPNGELIVAYQSGLGASTDVFFKRAPLSGLAAAAEVTIANTAAVAETNPFVIHLGGTVTIFFHRAAPTNAWRYRRYQVATKTWTDDPDQQLSAQVATTADFHAVSDTAGKIWAGFRSGANIHALCFDPSSGNVTNAQTLDSGTGNDVNPFLLADSHGDLWMFWNSPAGLYVTRFTAGAWQAPQQVLNTQAGDTQPSTVENGDGALWLFWTRGTAPNRDLYAMRRNPITGGWGQPRQVTLATGEDTMPSAFSPQDGVVWLFWTSDRDGNLNPYYKRIVTLV